MTIDIQQKQSWKTRSREERLMLRARRSRPSKAEMEKLPNALAVVGSMVLAVILIIVKAVL